MLEGGWNTAREKGWVVGPLVNDLIEECEKGVDNTPPEQRFPRVIRMALSALPVSEAEMADRLATAVGGIEAWLEGEIQPVESARREYIHQIKKWALQYKES